VHHCCRRLSEREAPAAARRGAAGALGVMPAGLLADKGEVVLGVLVSAVQVSMCTAFGCLYQCHAR
jgi:hypothetical protein